MYYVEDNFAKGEGQLTIDRHHCCFLERLPAMKDMSNMRGIRMKLYYDDFLIRYL